MLQGTGLRFEYLTPETIRREEYLQDVPITVQSISGEQLKQLNLTTFNDLLQYTPSVTYSGNGPATGNIFIRGLGSVGTSLCDRA